LASYKTVEEFRDKLDNSVSLADIFELVKQSVRQFLNIHRAGLMLGLADLGMNEGYFIGAFYPVGSNIIVMNRMPLEVATRNTDKHVSNAYCFHILLHEYLHSLGYLREREVRELTSEVCRQALGRDHPATTMAEQGIATYFPKMRYFPRRFSPPKDLQIELVRDFDKSNAQYIY